MTILHLLQVRTQKSLPSSSVQTISVHAARTCTSKLRPEPLSNLDGTYPLSRASLNLICNTFSLAKRPAYLVKSPANETVKHHYVPVSLGDVNVTNVRTEASIPKDRCQSMEPSIELDYSYLDYIWPLCPTIDALAQASQSTPTFVVASELDVGSRGRMPGAE
jgi:hypothetical protein